MNQMETSSSVHVGTDPSENRTPSRLKLPAIPIKIDVFGEKKCGSMFNVEGLDAITFSYGSASNAEYRRGRLPGDRVLKACPLKTSRQKNWMVKDFDGNVKNAANAIAFIPCQRESSAFNSPNNIIFIQNLLQAARSCENFQHAESVVIQLPSKTHSITKWWCEYSTEDWVQLLNNNAVVAVPITISVILVTYSVGNQIISARRNCTCMGISAKVSAGHLPPLSSQLRQLLELMSRTIDESANDVLNLLDNLSSWRLDAVSVCRLLRDQRNESNFPLMIMIALYLQRHFHHRADCFNEFLISTVNLFVVLYQWNATGLALVHNHPRIWDYVMPFIHQQVQARLDGQLVQTIHELVPLVQFHALLDRKVDCHSGIVMMVKDAFSKMGAGPVQVFIRNLNQAVQRAREWNPAAIISVDIEAIVKHGAPATRSLLDLEELLVLCHDNITTTDPRPCLQDALRQQFCRFIGNRRQLKDVMELYEICRKGKLASYLDAFLEVATAHVLQGRMYIDDVLAWFQFLRTLGNSDPTALLRYLQEKPIDKAELKAYLDAFEVAVTFDSQLMTPDRIATELRAILHKFLNSETTHQRQWTRFLTLVSCNHPLLQAHSTLFLDLLRLFLGSRVILADDVSIMCREMRYINSTETLNHVVELIVVKLLGEVRLDSPKYELFNSVVVEGAFNQYFWVRFGIRCAKRMKLLAHFDSMSSLTAQLRASKFLDHSNCMLSAWLDVVKKIENINRKTEITTAFIDSYVEPLRRKCNDVLFTEESILNSSCTDLEVLCDDNVAIVSMLEKRLSSPQQYANWSSLLNKHLSQWRLDFDYIQSHRPLLESLAYFLPVVMHEMEVATFFRASRGESTRESPGTMTDRATKIRRFVIAIDHKSRSFFEHFYVNAGQLASSKSVLFINLLSDQRVKQSNEKQWNTISAFVESLLVVHGLLERFLQLRPPELSFSETMMIGDILKKEARSPTAELQVLADYFTNGVIDSGIRTSLPTILDLIAVVDPVKELAIGESSHVGRAMKLSILERYGFACAHHDGDACLDADYAELKKIATDLCNQDMIGSWTISECAAVLAKLRNLLCPGVDDASQGVALGMLSFFQNLSAAEKVWEFIKTQPEFISAKGTGYSAVFNNKVEEFLSQLSGEDYRVLDNFIPVAQWVSILVANHQLPFIELMRNLCTSTSIMEQARRPLASKPFSQLRTTEANIEFLSSLFQKGLSALDAVIGQYLCISACCIYWFDLERVQLRLTYKDPKKQHSVSFNENEVRDFEQRLGFVQHEAKVESSRVEDYLSLLQQYRRLLVDMCELRTLGHRMWTSSPLVAHVVGQSEQTWDDCTLSLLASAHFVHEDDLSKLHEQRSNWKHILEATYKNNRVLRLLSTSIAQKIDVFISAKKATELALLICDIFPRSANSFDALRKVVKEVIENNTNIKSCNAKDIHTHILEWPERVSQFLCQVMRRMQQSGHSIVLSVLANVSLSNRSGPQRYSSHPSHLSLLRLLTVIYSLRPPRPFEILWCQDSTTAHELSAFLERASHFPDGCFTILQVDRLVPTLQHIVLSVFLEQRDPTTSSHTGQVTACNLHCVETGPSILQSISWIPVQNEDELAVEIDHDVIVREKLQQWVYDSSCIKKFGVSCFTGSTGCGKTYQMQKHLKSLNHCKTGVVSINEAFSFSRAIERMLNIIHDAGGRSVAIAFQINLGKFKRSEETDLLFLMEKISCFFISLLLLRFVEDPLTGAVFVVPPGCDLQICVELPDYTGHLEKGCERKTLAYRKGCFSLAADIPILMAVADIVDANTCPFDVGSEARHVCKYLKAYEDGSIDDLYGAESSSKNVVFVLDKSGSMAGGPLETCKRCLSNDIFATRISREDKVGLIVFDNTISRNIPLHTWDGAHENRVRNTLAGVHSGGGTAMWGAIQRAIEQLQQCPDNTGTKWIVALTDGAAGDSNLAPTIASLLRCSSGQSIRVLFITVALDYTMKQSIISTCIRDEKLGDSIIHADNGTASLVQAWVEVGERLTVSQKIEKKGANISDNDCIKFLQKYMRLNTANSGWSRLKQMYWIKYLYRRCGILAASEKFNKNQDMAAFGSTTMKIMLEEVEHALADNFHVDWNSYNHEQLVYSRDMRNVDGELVDDYKWSILATTPTTSDSGWQRRLKLLSSLKMHVPSDEDLIRQDIRVLESYLAIGIGVKLQNAKKEISSSGQPFDFAIGKLPSIEDNLFVLTLDFVLKMLCINERIECRVPCIMEGETGVSKTALTRMLFFLKNTVSRVPSLFVQTILQEAQEDIGNDAHTRELRALRKLADFYRCSDLADDMSVWYHPDKIAKSLCQRNDSTVSKTLIDELKADPGLDPLIDLEHDDIVTASYELLLWFVRNQLQMARRNNPSEHWTFHAVDVHAALGPDDISNDPVIGVKDVISRARRLKVLADLLDSDIHRRSTICIFFDEVNTSSCMGLFKEMLIDHSLEGDPLPDNIVLIAACNPARSKIGVTGERRQELGNEWAIGHYQVHPLPQSLQQMTWVYGSLNVRQEAEFIDKKLRFIVRSEGVPDANIRLMSNLIQVSQQMIRDFAREHISSLCKLNSKQGHSISEVELAARASSVVSLRDVLRVFKLFSYFLRTSGVIEQVFFSDFTYGGRCYKALLLSIAVLYYLRLGTDSNDVDKDFRRKFLTRLKNVCGQHEADVEGILQRSMSALMNHTELEPGIAKTRGLQENIFMVIVCCLAHVPLMIVGPPGSSKTLAVTIVAENARGEYSKSPFYRAAPTLIPFRYQCSRSSTSHEIKAVFDRAIERQTKANRDGGNIRCFVFMDEAGLPEEERESLKVLHFYLESHMHVSAEVGFVAISNHLLDAAKSNRCALLMRGKPDHEELMNIARGCLGSENERKNIISTVPGYRRGRQVGLKLDPSSQDFSQRGLLDVLCETYDSCMSETSRRYALEEDSQPPADFVEFLGNRDFIGFMKKLGELARADSRHQITTEKIVEALERNMNGVEPNKLKELITYFLLPFIAPNQRRGLAAPSRTLRNPVDLIRAALKEQQAATTPSCRYILVIDTTSNDSVLRALSSILYDRLGNNISSLKLSRFVEDSSIRQIHVISQVKWAAEKGQVVLLSQTEAINESFYDLFNQHFRKFEDKSEGCTEVVYHTNIAVGADSRRCKVASGFFCIVHITLAELQTTPAPFLNRFEKYRLTQADLLHSYLHNSNMLHELPALNMVLRQSKLFEHIHLFVELIHPRNFYGLANHQTIESAVLLILSSWTNIEVVADAVFHFLEDKDFVSTVVSQELKSYAGAAQCAANLSGDRVRIIEVLSRPANEHETKAAEAILSHMLLFTVVRQLVRVVAAEQLFRHTDNIPPGVIHSYLKQKEHFSLAKLLDYVVRETSVRKHIVFTHTSAAILALQTGAGINLAGATGTRLAIFAQYSRESQFTNDLKSFYDINDPNNVLLILIDSAQTSVSQVNFARYAVDEIAAIQSKVSKSILFLVHVPLADLRVHHFCDTTFSADWESTFLNDVDSTEVVTWLEMTFEQYQSNWDFKAVLQSWVPDILKVLARFIEVPDEIIDRVATEGGLLDKRIHCLSKVLQSLIGCSGKDNTVQDILISRYNSLWAGPDGNYSLLQEHIRERINKLATGELQGSLSDITLEVRNMFTNYLSRMIMAMLEDYNASVLFTQYDATSSLNNVNAVYIFAECLKSIPIPPFSELAAPLAMVHISIREGLSLSKPVFPFFRQLSKYVDVTSSQVIALYSDSEDEEIWEKITLEIVKRVRLISDDGDALATIAADVLFDSDIPNCTWQCYLQHFVHQLYPLMQQSEEQLQHRILVAWLSSFEGISMSKFKPSSLHAVAQWHHSLLVSLATFFEPLAQLTIADNIRDHLLSIMDGDEDVHSRLSTELVDDYYDIMQLFAEDEEVNSMSGIERWEKAFTAAKLSDAASSTQEYKKQRIRVMTIVAMLVRFRARNSSLSDEIIIMNGFRDIVRRLCSLESDNRITLSAVWKSIMKDEHEIFPIAVLSPLLIYRLLDYWCSTTALTEDDCTFIFDVVMLQSFYMPLNLVPILEKILFGSTWAAKHGMLETLSSKETTIVRMFEYFGKEQRRFDIIDLLEQSLKRQGGDCTLGKAKFVYTPHWLRLQCSADLKRINLLDVFFHFTWKWLTYIHETNDLKTLAVLVQELMTSTSLDFFPIQRAIAISAVQMLIVQRIADRISIFQGAQTSILVSGDESDRVIGVLELIDDPKYRLLWAAQLAYFVTVKIPLCTADSAISHLTECVAACEKGDKILGSWLQNAIEAFGQDSEQWFTDFHKEHPPLVSPLIKMIHDKLTHDRSKSLAKAFILMRNKLQCFWVIPDLIEFYDWVTVELSANPIPEALAKKITIENLMENAIKTENGIYSRRLWVRVKVGINRWVKMGGISSNQPLLDESMPVWSILSTKNSDSELFQNYLISVLRDLLDTYNEFLKMSNTVGISPLTKEYKTRPLDKLVDLDCVGLQDALQPDEMSLPDHAERFNAALELWSNGFDYMSTISTSVSRAFKWVTAAQDIDMTRLSMEFEDRKAYLPILLDVTSYQKFCRFGDAVLKSIPSHTETSYYFQIYHSLDYDSLQSLVNALRPIEEYVDAAVELNDSSVTIRCVLQNLYPGIEDEEYFISRAYINLTDEGQRYALLSTPVTELEQLREFLKTQISTQAYLFAHKGIEWKQMWPDMVDEQLRDLEKQYDHLADDARNLESNLVKYELLLKPFEPLHKSLVKAFRSESSLYKQMPLLKALQYISTATSNGPRSSFQFKGAHYVFLRQKLRSWASIQTQHLAVEKVWKWTFYFTKGASKTCRPIAHSDDTLKTRLTPWFLVDSLDEKVEERENAEREYFLKVQNESAVRIQKQWRGMKVRLCRKQFEKHTLQDLQKEKNDSVRSTKGRGRGRGGRGRGSGPSRGRGVGQLLQADARVMAATEQSQQAALGRLDTLCREWTCTESWIREIVAAIKEVEALGLNGESSPILSSAVAKLSDVQERHRQAKDQLKQALSCRPHQEDLLREAINESRRAGLAADTCDMEAAVRLIKQISNANNLLSAMRSSSYNTPLTIKKAITSYQYLELPMTESDLEMIAQIENEEQQFKDSCAQRWGEADAERVLKCCSDWHEGHPAGPFLPDEEHLQKQVQNALDILAKYCGANSEVAMSVLRKEVDVAIAIFEKPVLSNWPYVSLYLALANAAPSHIDIYHQDATEFIEEYVNDTMRTVSCPLDAVFFLVVSRTLVCRSDSEQNFRISCLRRCNNVAHARRFMTEHELNSAETPQGQAFIAPPEAVVLIDTPQDKWEKLKLERGSPLSAALDDMMQLVGLKAVKEKALEIYMSIVAELSLPAERRVPQTFNFALLGNPGTGKTTVGKILGKMLHEVGVRRSDSFEVITGEKLARMGADDVSALIDKATGGTLFIDEAYALDPKKNVSGESVAMQLLDVTEERRTDLTIILAGYKDEIETKLFDFNDGFNRRFNYIFNFEDYTEPEVAEILMQLCSTHNWPPADPSVIAVAARRISRGRGHKSFGNAGAVRLLFEKAYRSALTRDRNAQTLTVSDILGPPPTREHTPSLGQAIDELDAMIGLESVKKAIYSLINIAAVNYERELRGEVPYEVSLNRVFLGNPGTGKTTVAKLYGRILKGIGLLSDGAVELKQPSDLIGSAVGEAEKITAALIKRCRGKVLIIDEAYALTNTSYGHNALDTLTELVQGTPGEDISVVLIGYEKEMRKMFRGQNPGLTRRFALEDAFRFEDFNNADLDRVVVKLITEHGLSISRDLRKKVIKELAVRRSRPNFGNAGAAVSMISHAKQQLAARDALSKELVPSDFGLDRPASDGRAALAGLYKIEHIVQHLDQLKAVIQQSERDGRDRADHLHSYVFLGNPGTGKTTIARVMAEIFYGIGMLSTNKIVQCSGLDMQGSFVGQTKDKVNDLMADAQGGVLFIDEAYTLGAIGHGNGSTIFAQEAMDQLVALMTEPQHFHKTVVILAGYKAEMDKMMARANPGVKSRFVGRIEFPDWDSADCVNGVGMLSQENGIILSDDVVGVLQKELDEIRARPGWANARDCHTIFSFMYEARAVRCSQVAEIGQSHFVHADVQSAVEKLKKQRPNLEFNNTGSQHDAPIIYSAAEATSTVQYSETTKKKTHETISHSMKMLEGERKNEQEKESNISLNSEIYAYLLKACIDAGYDTSHEKRQDLIAILIDVQQNNKPFPDDIIVPIRDASGLRVEKIMRILKPQVGNVLAGMQNAVRAEEEHREELLRLQEEERLAKEREYVRKQEQLRMSGLCPMGYTWHREGNGWRCAGGSHRVNDI